MVVWRAVVEVMAFSFVPRLPGGRGTDRDMDGLGRGRSAVEPRFMGGCSYPDRPERPMGVRVVRIGLFGGVSAATDDGAPLDIGPSKCQTVLVVLALSAGSAVPVSRLVELVWGGEPPRTAEKTLQSYVVRLRTGLGADAIVRTGAAYRLT